jgi:repressor LexA
MGRQRITHLTEQQQRMAAFIRRRIVDGGEAPTLDEIGEEFGMRSRGTVAYHLQRMEAQGVIMREPYQPRGIRLT